MTMYKDNPAIRIKTITTVNGLTEYRRNCIKIRDSYYVKNVDCFHVDGKWYRTDSGYIIKDWELNEWVSKNKVYGLRNGIVAFEKNKPVIGYFSNNPYHNCLIQTPETGTVSCISADLAFANGYFEDVQKGIFRHKNDMSDSNYYVLTTMKTAKQCTNKGYNIEDNGGEYESKKELYDKYKAPLSKDVRKYARFLGDITFGIEAETSAGLVGDYVQNRLGLVACRDGSISGKRFGTLVKY